MSAQTRERITEIPWADIVGLRNRLIHGYDKVDFDVLWDIIECDLPGLIASLRKALDAGSGSGMTER